MPELNPLSNEQIFLKKIAENTGSDYNTGDVSEINPLTIDQILLKEIAANTAGLSGDMTELKGKVADNTGAIEAIVNVNGCCNVLDLSNPSVVSDGVTFTVNSDGSVTANGTAVTNSFIAFKNAATARDMVVVGASGGVHIIAMPYGHSWEEVDEGIIHGINQNGFALQVDAGVTVNNVTVYPMLYDARLNPTGYVPYAMTNRELTNEVVSNENRITNIETTRKMIFVNRYSSEIPFADIELYKTYMIIARVLGDGYGTTTGIALVASWAPGTTKVLTKIGGNTTFSETTTGYTATAGGNVWGIELDLYQLY